MLSQTTEYALRAMACLAQASEQLTPTPVLAELSDVPSNYLAKVLQQLSGAGLIVGRRGVGGGYRLARPAGEIRLIEIVHAVGTVRHFVEPDTEVAAKAGVSLVGLYKRLDAAARGVMEIYEEATLRDVVLDQAPSGSVAAIASSNGHVAATSNGHSPATSDTARA